MGTCELCGTDNVSTRQAIVSNVSVDACNRCIERMGLSLYESPYKKSRVTPTARGWTSTPRRPPSRGDIMRSESKELMPDFHVRIREARDSRGWDQKQFAMHMNERLNAVQKVENGSRPTDALLTKIEKMLDIELFGEPRGKYDTALSRGPSRNVTIADALDEFLSGEGSDD